MDEPQTGVSADASTSASKTAIVGVGRLSKRHGTGDKDAEFALIVADRFQHQGLGTELLRRLIQIGRDEHLARIGGEILPENVEMKRVCQKLGFRLVHQPGDGVVRALLEV